MKSEFIHREVTESAELTQSFFTSYSALTPSTPFLCGEVFISSSATTE